jgi:hypothetical protein
MLFTINIVLFRAFWGIEVGENILLLSVGGGK